MSNADKQRYFGNGFQAGSDSAIRAVLRIIVGRPTVDYDLIAEIRKMQEHSFLVWDHGQKETTMPKTVTPQPMPTTGMPDRKEPPVTDLGMKTGVMTTKGSGSFNPGRPAGGK